MPREAVEYGARRLLHYRGDPLPFGYDIKDDIKELAVGADVRSDDALSIRGRNVEGSKSDVIEWIDQLNY